MDGVDNRLFKDQWTQEKQRLRMPGIYQISNKLTPETYIGASWNIFLRWNSHLSAIRSGTHHCKRMSQIFADSDYDHPFDLFTIEVLERTTNLDERETFHIQTLRPSLNRQKSCY